MKTVQVLTRAVQSDRCERRESSGLCTVEERFLRGLDETYGFNFTFLKIVLNVFFPISSLFNSPINDTHVIGR